VVVRQRQYLVDEVLPPPREGDEPLTRLVCLDDDAQGRQISVLWKHELGAKVVRPAEHGLGTPERLDQPRHFAAYLHALKWSSVTATDARLFQSPFRAGIHLLTHQLVPLRKALDLPRVNLFIADDVGLGKTIEAGLVMQELVLRQRADFILVVCPASVTLQWRDEMEKRFGLRFEIYTRDFVARRRQQRGFAVNPWGTHHRFIVSYQTLRRSEYYEPLRQHLEHRGRLKTLLVLDEAHTAAPATASKYAVETETTRTIRRLAHDFEHRLFLSATPHNGHSNSFSALLEILDPQRFTRGTRVRQGQLRPVMVRRLKKDLKELGTEQQFPERRVIQVQLSREGGQWLAQWKREESPAVVGAAAGCPEIDLWHSLARYTELARPARGRGRLVFVNLQKRLLSSIEAFHRTLSVHARALGVGGGRPPAAAPADLGSEEHGPTDEALEEESALEMERSTRLLEPDTEALALLSEMLALADRTRANPDAKLLALLWWIRQHQSSLRPRAPWTDRRVIVFTEYGDTLRYLKEQLFAVVEGTESGDQRVRTFQGGMGDRSREEIQAAFNGDPDQHPVRILLATDAAREGINLQGHCADLFHYDVPWNPARLEQRNGRIDRTLQPAPEVRCHYFTYREREADAVLETLAEKVPVIQQELGSLASVLADEVEETMAGGIGRGTLETLRGLEGRHRDGAAWQELEATRKLEELRRERDEVSKIRGDSARVMDFRAELLRDAVNVGLELGGAGRLGAAVVRDGEKEVEAWQMPQMPASWERTLDSLRPPRAKDEAPWDWRQRPLLPVVFEPPERINSPVCQLHLSHPVVQRLMQRFLAQGFSASDLSRVTVVRSKRDSVARVIAFGRLSLFGAGAARLHDEVLSVAAQWLEGGGKGHLKPFAEDADRKAIEQLENTLAEAPELDAVPAPVRKRLLASAAGDFQKLWGAIAKEGEQREEKAREMLRKRGQEEAAALRRILEEQRATIEEELGRQLEFNLEVASERDQHDQWRRDRNHLKQRLAEIDGEMATQPEELKRYYEVRLTRIVPVGMVYLWPHSR
jgi:hypothetical protein